MLYLLLIILFAIGAWLIFLANLDAEYSVRRSRSFDQDVGTVFDKLCDFPSWPQWNPWLAHEPATRLEYSDTPNTQGGYYTWDGQLVGTGRLTHVRLQRPNRLEQRLEFTRPFKNICNVQFELFAESGKTRVDWSMQASMPFFLRFMQPRMKRMIEQDYDLGLAMLAGALAPTAEHPKIEYQGETDTPALRCLCKSFKGNLVAMQQAMEEGFPELINHLQRHDVKPAAEPRCYYHRVDIDKLYFECDMAIPVDSDLPVDDYTLQTLGAGRHYQVLVHGGYQFLELAWYAAMAHIQMLRLRVDKQRPSTEIYLNDPQAVEHSNDIKTLLLIPLR